MFITNADERLCDAGPSSKAKPGIIPGKQKTAELQF